MTDPIAWASEVFAPFNLAWKEAPAKRGTTRLLGATADQAALVDVTIRHSRVVAASAVLPIDAAYTAMLVWLLAVLVDTATRKEADAFLARALSRLRRDRPSETAAPWHRWRVILTTNTLGLLTMQVR